MKKLKSFSHAHTYHITLHLPDHQNVWEFLPTDNQFFQNVRQFLPTCNQFFLQQTPSGFFQFNSILILSAWKKHQIPEVKCSASKIVPSLQMPVTNPRVLPVLLTNLPQIGVPTTPVVLMETSCWFTRKDITRIQTGEADGKRRELPCPLWVNFPPEASIWGLSRNSLSLVLWSLMEAPLCSHD
jgi:hypothetical protein